MADKELKFLVVDDFSTIVAVKALNPACFAPYSNH